MATRKMLGSSQIDASDAFHDYSCSPCSEDGKNAEALFHCNVCEMFYCQRCVAVHNKFTKDHKITDKSSDKFGLGLGKSATSSNNLPSDLCEEHHGEVVKMFCPQHDVVCCTVCIAVKHRSCKGVEYIPNIARELLKKQGKVKTKHSLEKVKADLKDLKSKMENDLKDLDKQRDGIIDDIQEFKKRIIDRVEKLERTSLKEVRSKHKELADDINAYSKKIDAFLKVMDTRLNKLTLSKDNNEAQQFVDVKNGEKELSEGIDIIKRNTARNRKSMAIKINTSIEGNLSKEQSFGSLKECISYQACVSILCPFGTEATNAFVSELQTQLKRYDIESKYIRPKEPVVGRYTIVLFANGRDKEDEAVKEIKGVDDNMVILVNVKPHRRLVFNTCHGRKFKASLKTEYITQENDQPSVTFPLELNQTVYKLVSNIVKNPNSTY